MAEPRKFVLDSSALLALRGNEVGADRVEEILRAARRRPVLLSFTSRMELLYRIGRDEGEDAARDALRLVDSFGVQWISCEPGILEEAASIKTRGGLSVADAWIAATAKCNGAVLVHKDPEFRSLEDVEQEELHA